MLSELSATGPVMTDPNKKIPRSFQCREALWQKFEQMAKELECSVDYLINDAMKQYARQRGYGTATSLGPAAPSIATGGPPPGSGMPSKEILLFGLLTGEIGSGAEGPALDALAPDFTLKSPDGKEAITLSSFKGKKPVALIFGSFT